MGAKILEELLRAPESFQRQQPCECGQTARFYQMRPRKILTAVGSVRFERPYYLCPASHQGQSPRDVELDVVDTEFFSRSTPANELQLRKNSPGLTS